MAHRKENVWRDRLGALGFNRRTMADAWSRFLHSKASGLLPVPEAGLDEAQRWRRRIDDCLAARGGLASARARAADLGRAYLALDEDGRTRFLKLLAAEYGPDRARLRAASRTLAEAGDSDFPAALHGLTEALVAPRIDLLRQFNGLEQGVKFLVDLRADLLRRARQDGALSALEGELHRLLASWFDVGFLELRRITWQAPAALLEKLVAYEAVHEIRSWQDLKNRLDSDRRCYGFFHPAMPDEPLIFVEIALVHGLASNVQALLDEAAPAIDPRDADTAIFYSISNAQAGLQGVAFGDFLIKRVVDVLAHDLPNLKSFATLSPIPGFRAWLKRRLIRPPALLSPAEAQALGRLAGAREPAGALLDLLEKPAWTQDEGLTAILVPLLTRLCAHYLIKERRPAEPHRALDPVAHFHLSNGARIERLNWLADRSANGLAQSAGLMVNYAYRPADIEMNHERYRSEGRIAMASAVRALA